MATHVQIRPREGGGYHLLVDGADISKAVIADSVEIRFNGDAEASVILALAAGTLDADLPGAVIEAVRVTEDEDGR